MNKFAVNKSAMTMMNLMIIRSMIIVVGLIPVRIIWRMSIRFEAVGALQEPF